MRTTSTIYLHHGDINASDEKMPQIVHEYAF